MMKYKTLYYIICLAVAQFFVCSCSDDEWLSSGAEAGAGGIITVGADIEGLTVSSSMTRATESKDAETVPWLVQPLLKGLDIRYGNLKNNNTNNRQNERVAILKLVPSESGSDKPYKTNDTSGYAEYTFKYRSDTDGSETSEVARWYDNGLHFFEGQHVPNRIRYTNNLAEMGNDRTNYNDVPNVKAVTHLTTDQSADVSTGEDNDLSNYYLLSHYLGMPANTQIAATVARIKLPFRHRLARVLAYILIDPTLMNGPNHTKIKGYKNIETDNTKPFRDDPTTSDIRFCNVDVLSGVHDVYNSTTKVHTLTPTWAEGVRKVIPHFSEQIPTFKTYQSEDKTYYQGNSDFPSSIPTGFTEVIYENVPVYDLIVRPTYTSYNNVMYDEYGYENSDDRQDLADKTNKIDFIVSLDNGLTYEKEFVFDLDANYQTIVYLKISREGVDYNESGSALWVEETRNDDWYGVDNLNGHTLSNAGCSWQRAFYNASLSDDKITDGGFYDEQTNTGEDGTAGQYLTDETWKEYFLQAYKGGAHHGDYFVLSNDITIDANELPNNFVFTGHLDGFTTHPNREYKTITLTGGNSWAVYDKDELRNLKQKTGRDDTDASFSAVPQLYWTEEVAHARPHRANNIVPEGDPTVTEIPMNSYPAVLTQLDNEGKVIVYKDGNGKYQVYTNRTFYRKTAGSLFDGLDGIYTTNQEQGLTPWEANVHKEGDFWLPYRDIGTGATNTGWRAEVMNLTVEGGSLFKGDVLKYEDTDNNPETPPVLTGYDVTKVSGYVYNCKEVDGQKKVLDHTPAMPRYK